MGGGRADASTAATGLATTGAVLGDRYRLGALLGRGGMAEVYDAIDERLRRPVAVKVLRPEMAARPDVRKRFEDEARAAAALGHPNVVAVYDTGEDETDRGSVAWIVMERLPGETLADRMGSDGGLEPEWVARVAGDVLGALGAAHAAGIIHRDIKPGNILLGGDGCAKVADFGIAKSLEAVDDTTNTGALIGTPAYLAPERIDGQPATPQSDLYGLGVVLYEALAGEKPFRGTTPVSVAYAVHHSPVRPLDDLRTDLPPTLVAAVHRAMDRDPARRFATAEEMLSALAGAPDDATIVTAPADSTLIIEQPVEPTRPTAPAAAAASPPIRRDVRHPRGTRALVVALVAVLALLVLIGATLANDDKPAEASLADRITTAADDLQPSDGPAATTSKGSYATSPLASSRRTTPPSPPRTRSSPTSRRGSRAVN